ncbi:MAG: cytochrome c [Kiloniellales bacterium]|nr:cytochrome c [Kiloniellales bacterium]
MKAVRPAALRKFSRNNAGSLNRAPLFLSILVAVLVLLPSAVHAGDISAGKAKAVKCKQCHGLDGIGKTPDTPNIAGQKIAYLIQQLEAYRDGARQNDMMTFIASSLSDEDIRNLAAYYAAIKVDVTLPD